MQLKAQSQGGGDKKDGEDGEGKLNGWSWYCQVTFCGVAPYY